MLEKEMRNILKQVTKIGNSAILRYPISSITNTDKSMIAFIDMEKLEGEFEELGLFHFSEFLSLVDFYENPEVSFKDGTITITADDGLQHYQTTPIQRLKSVDVPDKLLKAMESIEPLATVSVKSEDIDRAKKIGSLAKADSFVINANEDSASVIVCKIDDNGKISNDSEISLEGEASTPVKIELKLSNIDKLPSYDYSVKAIMNPKSKNFVTIWEADSAPIKIVVTVTQTI